MPSASATAAAASTAFSSLPASVQAELAQAAPPGVADGTAAVGLALTILAGQVPSESQIVTAMGAIATLAGGTGIGEVMAACGAGVLAFTAILQSVFQALGFYAPPVTFEYEGLQRTSDPKPTGPTDPNWIPCRTFQDWGAVLGVAYGPNPEKLPGGRPAYSPGPETNANPFTGFWGPQSAGIFNLMFWLAAPTARWQWDHGAWSQGVFLPTTALPPPFALDGPRYATLSPFEQFFAHMLLQNFQFWANALPFLPPQLLLASAAAVWNAQNSSPACVAGATTYSASSDWTGAGTDAPWSPTCSLPSIVLGPMGDPNGVTPILAPLTVNAGKVSALSYQHTTPIGPGFAGAGQLPAQRWAGALLAYGFTSVLLILLALAGSVAITAAVEKGARRPGDRF